MLTSFEIDRAWEEEKEPEERLSIGGSEKNWIFKPNSTMFKIKEFEVSSFQED